VKSRGDECVREKREERREKREEREERGCRRRN
jgi:hypothetical protein